MKKMILIFLMYVGSGLGMEFEQEIDYLVAYKGIADKYLAVAFKNNKETLFLFRLIRNAELACVSFVPYDNIENPMRTEIEISGYTFSIDPKNPKKILMQLKDANNANNNND